MCVCKSVWLCVTHRFMEWFMTFLELSVAHQIPLPRASACRGRSKRSSHLPFWLSLVLSVIQEQFWLAGDLRWTATRRSGSWFIFWSVKDWRGEKVETRLLQLRGWKCVSVCDIGKAMSAVVRRALGRRCHYYGLLARTRHWRQGRSRSRSRAANKGK